MKKIQTLPDAAIDCRPLESRGGGAFIRLLAELNQTQAERDRAIRLVAALVEELRRIRNGGAK